MFSKITVAGLISFLAISSVACAASFNFTLEEGDEFILAPTNQDSGGVYVYLDGANDLELEEVVELSCEHGNYAIPVIKAHIETGVSSGIRREYFVYEKSDADYVPVKAMLSVYSVDRETGEVISEPPIATEDDIRVKQLCDYIPRDNAIDQSVWPVEQ